MAGMNMKFEHMETIQSFEVPTVIKHGIGIMKYAGEEIKSLGVSKVLLVTDQGIYHAGMTKTVEESLAQAGVEVILFNQVEANPPVRIVNEGSKVYKENNCDN